MVNCCGVLESLTGALLNFVTAMTTANGGFGFIIRRIFRMMWILIGKSEVERWVAKWRSGKKGWLATAAKCRGGSRQLEATGMENSFQL